MTYPPTGPPPEENEETTRKLLGVQEGWYTFQPQAQPANYADPLSPDYTGPRGTFNIYAPVPAQYRKGDEMNPAAIPGAEGVEYRINLQQALKSVGLLTGNYIVSEWDDKSSAAYAELLGIANRTGLDKDEMLTRLIQSGTAKPIGDGGGTARLLPHPDDIKKLGNSTARDLIGMDLNPAQQDAFVNAFTAALEPQGGYQAPDPSTIAETYIENTMPGEVGAQTGTDHFEAFLKMLGGL